MPVLPMQAEQQALLNVRNVTAMLLKGLASHLAIGLKKEEKKKFFARVSWKDIKTGLLIAGET